MYFACYLLRKLKSVRQPCPFSVEKAAILFHRVLWGSENKVIVYLELVILSINLKQTQCENQHTSSLWRGYITTAKQCNSTMLPPGCFKFWACDGPFFQPPARFLIFQKSQPGNAASSRDAVNTCCSSNFPLPSAEAGATCWTLRSHAPHEGWSSYHHRHSSWNLGP